MISSRKEKIESIIFIRACCCIGIIIFHYFCDSKGKFKLLYKTANSNFGFMFVTSFFCISGFVLFYNYPKITSFKSFYYKRWKSILVPFYICYIYFFLRNVFRVRKLFYYGDMPKIILTIIGLDGYLSYKMKTYYFVGEWFLGAIIIIYALYPILLSILTKNIIINNIFICFSYFLMYKANFFIIDKTRNMITCITSFYFGIEAIRFKRFYLIRKKIFIISIFIFSFLCFVKIKINCDLIVYQIQGFSLFIALYHIGKYIMKTKINIIFFEISKLSYSIYLFHRRILFDILSVNNPIDWYSHLMQLSLLILLTFICSKIHLMVVNSIYKGFLFKKLDSLFI